MVTGRFSSLLLLFWLCITGGTQELCVAAAVVPLYPAPKVCMMGPPPLCTVVAGLPVMAARPQLPAGGLSLKLLSCSSLAVRAVFDSRGPQFLYPARLLWRLRPPADLC